MLAGLFHYYKETLKLAISVGTSYYKIAKAEYANQLAAEYQAIR